MGNRGSRPDPDLRAGYAALAHRSMQHCLHVARTSQTRLQRHTALGTGRSATHVASRHAEELQGGLCAFKTPAEAHAHFGFIKSSICITRLAVIS